MDTHVKKHKTLAAADVDGVIVTLFLQGGLVRGWYIGPPSFNEHVPMSWQTSPSDNIIGTVALVRAMNIADKLGLELSIVDPDDLWDQLSGPKTIGEPANGPKDFKPVDPAG